MIWPKKNTVHKLAGDNGVAPKISFDVLNQSLSLQLWELALACFLLMCTVRKLVIKPGESLERGWHQVTYSRWQSNFQVEHRPSRASWRWAGEGLFFPLFIVLGFFFTPVPFFYLFYIHFFHLLQPMLDKKKKPLISFGLTVMNHLK